jgi:hypothetical protein
MCAVGMFLTSRFILGMGIPFALSGIMPREPPNAERIHSLTGSE